MNHSKRAALALAAMLLLATTAQAAGTAVPQPAPPAAAQTETAAQTAVKADAVSPEDWQLLLVNPWHTLPKDYQVELVKLKNGLQVDGRIYDDLNAMLTDCRKAGLSPIVCSAYRTNAKQTSLYNNKIARLRAAGYGREAAVTEAGRWVAVPGTSEHQTGLALDLVAASYQLLNEKQEETAEQKWLMEHSWEYGFILRYPSDKSAVTGIGYEPWHYRYVGKAAAAAIRESGLCLEEYIQTLAAPETEKP